jgi:hypothetical protein
MTRMRIFLIGGLAAAAMLASSLAGAAEIDITKGQLQLDGPIVTQFLTVKNNRTTKIGHLGIECVFLHGDDPVAAGGGRKDNVAAGETVYFEIIATRHVATEVRTDCRIDYASCE